MVRETLICDGQRVETALLTDVNQPSKTCCIRIGSSATLDQPMLEPMVLRKESSTSGRRFRMDHGNIAWAIAAPIPFSFLESSKSRSSPHRNTKCGTS